MKGFFTEKEIESTTLINGKIASCTTCGLKQGCKYPEMQPFGNFKKRIMNIGEFPSASDDEKGIPFQGRTGRILKRTYSELGIDLFEDCINLNAINCFSEDAKITKNQVEICRKRQVLKAIDQYKPDIIVLLGTLAVQSVIGYRWKHGTLDGINRWRGFVIPDQDLNAWVCPVFSPSYVEQADKEVETIWKADLKEVFKKIDQSIKKNNKPVIEVIEDLSILDSITCDMTAFDYETTGKKPHAEGHRIICASIADHIDHAYVFMMPRDEEKRKPFIRYLTNNNIGKMAHNMKFEDNWTEVQLNTTINYWMWDSMIAAHILDNRQMITGLKFQTYVNFGVIDYSSEIEPYMKSSDVKNDNAFNKLDELLHIPGGKEKLLTYNAWDSIWQYRLAVKQQKEMNWSYLPF